MKLMLGSISLAPAISLTGILSETNSFYIVVLGYSILSYLMDSEIVSLMTAVKSKYSFSSPSNRLKSLKLILPNIVV